MTKPKKLNKIVKSIPLRDKIRAIQVREDAAEVRRARPKARRRPWWESVWMKLDPLDRPGKDR